MPALCYGALVCISETLPKPPVVGDGTSLCRSLESEMTEAIDKYPSRENDCKSTETIDESSIRNKDSKQDERETSSDASHKLQSRLNQSRRALNLYSTLFRNNESQEELGRKADDVT